MDRMDRIIERSKQLRKEANLRLVKEGGGGQAVKNFGLGLWRFFTGYGKNQKVDDIVKKLATPKPPAELVTEGVTKTPPMSGTLHVTRTIAQPKTPPEDVSKEVLSSASDDVAKLLNQKGWASFHRGAAYTGAATVGVPWLLSGGEYQPPTQDGLSGGSGSGGEGSKGINWLPWMLGVPAAGAAGVGLYKILNSKKPEPLPRIEDAVLSDDEIAAELRKRQEEQFQNEELYA